MRDLMYYAKECMRELDEIGIKYGNIIDVVPNTRAKKRWGQCRKISGGYHININICLFDDQSSVEGLKTTILHELLHSCPGCMNHGEAWKELADKVNERYGYKIKRTTSADEKGVSEEVRSIIHADKEPKYKIVCTKCGQVIERARMSKLIKHPENFRCALCKGKLRRV